MEMPEPPAISWQASSTTQKLANWVHNDEQLTSQISSGMRRGRVPVHNTTLTTSQTGEMYSADNIRHDFTKKHAVEETRPAEPVVENAVVAEPE